LSFVLNEYNDSIKKEVRGSKDIDLLKRRIKEVSIKKHEFN